MLKKSDLSNEEKRLLLNGIIRPQPFPDTPEMKDEMRGIWRRYVIDNHLHDRLFGARIMELCIILHGRNQTTRQRNSRKLSKQKSR